MLPALVATAPALVLEHINVRAASQIPYSFNLPTSCAPETLWLSNLATLPTPIIYYPLLAYIRTISAMAAASTNQWAAVGDAVNSAALVELGFNIVRSSLPYLSVAVGVTKVYSRGAGGYCDRLNELETIIQSWDAVLGDLPPATIARIDADFGPQTVQGLCERLSMWVIVVAILSATVLLILATSIKLLFGRLRATHVKASFWEKIALWKTPLSGEYADVRDMVTSADAHFKVRSIQTSTTDSNLTLGKLYAGFH